MPRKKLPRDERLNYEIKCYYGGGKKYCFRVYKTIQGGFNATTIDKTFSVIDKWEKGRLKFKLYRKTHSGGYSRTKVKQIKQLDKKD